MTKAARAFRATQVAHTHAHSPGGRRTSPQVSVHKITRNSQHNPRQVAPSTESHDLPAFSAVPLTRPRRSSRHRMHGVYRDGLHSPLGWPHPFSICILVSLLDKLAFICREMRGVRFDFDSAWLCVSEMARERLLLLGVAVALLACWFGSLASAQIIHPAERQFLCFFLFVVWSCNISVGIWSYALPWELQKGDGEKKMIFKQTRWCFRFAVVLILAMIRWILMLCSKCSESNS